MPNIIHHPDHEAHTPESLSAQQLAEFRERLAGFRVSAEFGIVTVRTPEPEVRDIAIRLLAEVDRLNEALADQESTTRYYAEQSKRRGEELKKLDRSRPTNEAYDRACEALRKHRERADKAEAELAAKTTTLLAVQCVKSWKNEDGKQFVFADDLRAALGYGRADGGGR